METLGEVPDRPSSYRIPVYPLLGDSVRESPGGDPGHAPKTRNTDYPRTAERERPRVDKTSTVTHPSTPQGDSITTSTLDSSVNVWTRTKPRPRTYLKTVLFDSDRSDGTLEPTKWFTLETLRGCPGHEGCTGMSMDGWSRVSSPMDLVPTDLTRRQKGTTLVSRVEDWG